MAGVMTTGPMQPLGLCWAKLAPISREYIGAPAEWEPVRVEGEDEGDGRTPWRAMYKIGSELEVSVEEWGPRLDPTDGCTDGAPMANVARCLRDAGALAAAWNRGACNGAAWADGRVVLQRFGPPETGIR